MPVARFFFYGSPFSQLTLKAVSQLQSISQDPKRIFESREQYFIVSTIEDLHCMEQICPARLTMERLEERIKATASRIEL